MDDIKIRRLGWAGRTIRMEDERIPRKVLSGKFHTTRPVGKPRRRLEHDVRRDISQILGIRLCRRWAEGSEKWRVPLRGPRAQSPEGAVAPYMDWNSFTLINFHGVFRDNFALTSNFTFTFNRLWNNEFIRSSSLPATNSQAYGVRWPVTATWTSISHLSSARN